MADRLNIQIEVYGGSVGTTWIDASEREDEIIAELVEIHGVTREQIISDLKSGKTISHTQAFNSPCLNVRSKTYYNETAEREQDRRFEEWERENRRRQHEFGGPDSEDY